MKRLSATTLIPILACLMASPAWADAQAECEEWARADNVSAMLWDRYVESCVQSLQGEEINETPDSEKETPAGSPATPEPPGIDLSY